MTWLIGYILFTIYSLWQSKINTFSCHHFILVNLHNNLANSVSLKTSILNFSGSANDLCKKKGTFVWDKDDHFYFFCAGEKQNLGCQECPAKDLFYSLHCKACLTRDDVINKKCPPPVTVTGPPDFCKTNAYSMS